MQIFSLNFNKKYFQIDHNTYSIKFEIEEIREGFIIKGKIKGRARLVKIFEDNIDTKIFVNDWQSWGESKILDSKAHVKRSSSFYNPSLAYASDSLVSDYFVATDNRLFGFLSSRTAHGFFKIKEGILEGYLDFFDKFFDEYTDFESIIVIEGENLEALLETYADYVKFENKLKIKSWIPYGWSSWYQYFDGLKWKDVEKNLKLSRGYGYEVFQIDDSWQKNIGDWEPKRGYPSLKDMAKQIHEYDMIAGIWIAPFSVAENSELFLNHKDWLVKDQNDLPKIAYYNWNRNIYSLDLTNPEALRYLYELFKKLKECGFEYFKIDFLFCGAMEGKRYESNITPIEAYRNGMNLIRKSVKDSFVLGCGAPFLPSLGFVDGMRVSEDTAPIYVVDNKVRLNAYFALKNSLNRYFMNGKWWHNDPDCLLLRKDDTKLNTNIMEIYAYSSALLNNIMFQSDDLSLNISKDILVRALELRGGASKIRGISNGNYEIISIHPKFGKIKMKINLEKVHYEMTIEKGSDRLAKTSITKDDKRIFNFYTSGD